MMTYMELSVMEKGFIALWFMVLLLLACIAVFRLLFQKNYALTSLAALVTAVCYVLVQQCVNFTRNNEYLKFPHTPIFIERISCDRLLLTAALLTAINIGLHLYAGRWNMTHISAASLKEGMDDLPVGLCWYYGDGTPLLRNHVMERLCVQITGDTLYDGTLLSAELCSRMDDSHVMVLDDGTVWSVLFHTQQNNGAVIHEICAYDITEEYKVTRLLLEKQREVQLKSEELTQYNRELSQMITAEEILAAKVHVHDELGEVLLLTRKYLLRGGTAEDREKLLQVLRKNNTLMERRSGREKSYLEGILEAASDMGVRVIIDGSLPENETIGDIITTAIHENLTNTIRHAQGDEMRVKIRSKNGICTAVFTNSGRVPNGNVEERGGLAALRMLTESAGGEMEIEHSPRFKMTLRFITLDCPGKGEHNGTSADM